MPFTITGLSSAAGSCLFPPLVFSSTRLRFLWTLWPIPSWWPERRCRVWEIARCGGIWAIVRRVFELDDLYGLSWLIIAARPPFVHPPRSYRAPYPSSWSKKYQFGWFLWDWIVFYWLNFPFRLGGWSLSDTLWPRYCGKSDRKAKNIIRWICLIPINVQLCSPVEHYYILR